MTKRKPFLLVQIKLCFFDLTQLNISCEEKITIKGDANKFQGSPLMLKHLLLNEESIHCSSCMLGHICVPSGLNPTDIERLSQLVKERIRIPKGVFFYKVTDPLTAIYSIRSGSMKTQLENENGHVQITGFFLPGEILGLDGIGEGQHLSNAIALEDTEVCVLRINELDSLSLEIPALQAQFRRLLSKEISRSHGMVLALGAMRSEQRVASFLLDMSERYTNLGYSPNEFILRMSREEIGNYLGLTLETVSRLICL